MHTTTKTVSSVSSHNSRQDLPISFDELVANDDANLCIAPDQLTIILCTGGRKELQINFADYTLTPGSLAFIFEDEGKTCAFVGDLIFEGSVGRTDLWGGDFPTLEKSVKKIYELPDSTVIYPGHGYPTSVGVEKTSNPFVRG